MPNAGVPGSPAATLINKTPWQLGDRPQNLVECQYDTATKSEWHAQFSRTLGRQLPLVAGDCSEIGAGGGRHWF